MFRVFYIARNITCKTLEWINGNNRKTKGMYTIVIIRYSQRELHYQRTHQNDRTNYNTYIDLNVSKTY